MTDCDILVIGDGSDALGRRFGGLLHEREAVFLRSTEWARTAADVLERRTKHHLHMTEAKCAAFTAWWG